MRTIASTLRTRTSFRGVFFVVIAGATSTAVVVACGDGGTDRPSFAGLDATDSPESSLPPPSAEASVTDAGADVVVRRDYDASDEPVVCTATPCATQLVAGDTHFCTRMSDGTARCWGKDTKGSLGRGDLDGGTDAGHQPAPVVGITDAVAISTGAAGSTTCVVTAAGLVKCWGDNTSAQLGFVPAPVPGIRDQDSHATPSGAAVSAQTARVDVGQTGACSIAVDGKVYCWGANDTQQLARPGFTDYYGGVGVAELGSAAIARLVVGQYSVFAVTKDGSLLGWGRVSGRDSSLSSNDGTPTAVALPTLSGVTDAETSGFVSGSGVHQCAIAGGNVYCWGDNQLGVLGTGVPDAERLPAYAGIVADSMSFPQQLALAVDRTCVRMTDGSVQCCGNDKLGQLGRGVVGTFSTRFGKATAFADHAVQVATSTAATCVLVQGGKVACWGGNANGELGQGTIDALPHPTPVTVVFQ